MQSPAPPLLLQPQLEERELLELIRTEGCYEFCLYFPEWKEKCQKLLDKLENMCNTIQNTFDELSQLKDFAKRADQFGYGFLMFQMQKNGSKDIREHFALASPSEFEGGMKKLKSRTKLLEDNK